VLLAKIVKLAKYVISPYFYLITLALLNAQLDIVLKDNNVLNATLLAKHAHLMTLPNVLHVLPHINYGKEDVHLNALLEHTQQALEPALPAILLNAQNALVVKLVSNAWADSFYKTTNVFLLHVQVDMSKSLEHTPVLPVRLRTAITVQLMT
jgi:hypothetical protein